ncbi:cell death regulator Aven-like [Sinocyclocheilus rhinocerous]|uniref:Cell death regulator Aven-like n=1 Tax=Sinocyclocheilus rhinocerous TaxID=307959 RepID=A0A673IL26_9TELE|nr:PREDICTED: cell death regulator Aven-like [Sinocyclocheilus rhinocerous]
MEGRRGRGGHWKRGGGCRGGAESGSSGEHRGRGRGGRHHRGRGKRDHRRGRGREFGPSADFRNFRRNQDDSENKENIEQEEEDNTFSRRKLEANWDRYEESEKEEMNEDVPTQRGTDYHVLLTSAGDSFTQFRFSDEKDWEMDSLAKNQIPALFIDLPALTQSLQELPLHTRLNLEAELVQVTTPVELPSVTVPHRTDSTLTAGLKASQASPESGLGVSCSVKPASGTTPSLGVSTAVPPATDDADQELDLLLNLQKTITEITSAKSHAISDDVLNTSTQGSEEKERKAQIADKKETKPEVESEAKPTRQEVTEEDLEDWLDSMLS